MATLAEEGLPVASTSVLGGRDGGSAVPSSGLASGAVASVVAALADQVTVSLEEKLILQLERDGGLAAMEVKGTAFVQCLSAEAARVQVRLRKEDSDGFQFQTHPNMDKAVFASEGVLVSRNRARDFPLGERLGLLRWKKASRDEGDVPLAITCWPDELGNGTMQVNLEYTLQGRGRAIGFSNVVIAIPLGTTDAPSVSHADGSVTHDAKAETLLWHVDAITAAAPSGSLEFTVRGRSGDVFFPVRVSLESAATMASVEVLGIDSFAEDGNPTGRPVRYSVHSGLSVEEFVIR